MINKRISIKYRIIFYIIIIILTLSFSISFFSIKISTKYITSITEKHLVNILQYFNSIAITDLKSRTLRQGASIAGNPKVAGLIELKDSLNLNSYLAYYPGAVDFEITMIYGGAGGNTFLASNIKPGPVLNYIDSVFWKHNMNKNSVFIEGYENEGLFVLSAVPVKNARGEIIGKVISGANLSKMKITEKIKETFEIDTTIFYMTKRINTTIEKNGVSQTGSSVSPEIADIVLQKNRTYTGKVNVLGTPYIASYMPVAGVDGKPVGIIAVGSPMANIEKAIYKIITIILIFTVITLIVLIILSYLWSVRRMINPIISISSAIKRVSERDLDIPNSSPDFDRNDEISDLHYALIDMVTAIKEYESRMEHLVYYDNMTRLPNKVMLFEQFSCLDYLHKDQSHCPGKDDTCPDFRSEGRLGVMLYLNVDELKIVNSIFGHRTGDFLLIEMAERLKDVSKEHNYIAFRYGGDEFILCNEKSAEKEDVEIFVNEIIQSIREPFYISGNSINMSVSIGISLCPENATDMNHMLKNAGIAMSKAKENGRNAYMFFNDSMTDELESKVAMEKELRNSITNEDFFLHFQPQYDTGSGKITGFETLARWKNAKNNLIPPNIFIPLAEETGCIIRLGEWIIKKSFEFIMGLNSKMNNNYKISINISIAQIMQDNFVAFIEENISKYNIDPCLIELEITESILIESFEIVKEKLEHLKNIGISLALDDFGKGYSSLSYLKLLPISTLKLDKIFIDDIADQSKKNNIAEDIIRIGHRMGLKIVAEGVESKEQFDIIKKYNCDIIQGYYLSKPLPEEELMDIL